MDVINVEAAGTYDPYYGYDVMSEHRHGSVDTSFEERYGTMPEQEPESYYSAPMLTSKDIYSEPTYPSPVPQRQMLPQAPTPKARTVPKQPAQPKLLPKPVQPQQACAVPKHVQPNQGHIEEQKHGVPQQDVRNVPPDPFGDSLQRMSDLHFDAKSQLPEHLLLPVLSGPHGCTRHDFSPDYDV